MSTTIPAVRLREQAAFTILAQREAAYAYAESLRSNRIDWLSANSLICAARAQAVLTCTALSDALFDLPAERAELERMRDDFDALIDTTLDDLRKTCLLNGPATRRAA